jgi:hypothetical protein
MRKVYFTEPEAKLVRALVRNRMSFLDRTIEHLEQLEGKERTKRLKEARKVRRKLGIVEYKISNPKAKTEGIIVPENFVPPPQPEPIVVRFRKFMLTRPMKILMVLLGFGLVVGASILTASIFLGLYLGLWTDQIPEFMREPHVTKLAQIAQMWILGLLFLLVSRLSISNNVGESE